MKKSLLFYGIFSILLIACQNNSKPSNQNEASSNNPVHESKHQEQQSEQLSSVSLNNGQKWIANKETSEGIQKMASLIKEFSDQPKWNECASLKLKLETEFNLILQKCTMSGEAHNQLHNFLIPMEEMFQSLNSQDMATCESTLNKLKQYLGEYENYFQ